jgi:hypothetical protein
MWQRDRLINYRFRIPLQKVQHPLVHLKARVHAILALSMKRAQARHGQLKTRPVSTHFYHHFKVLFQHALGDLNFGVAVAEEECVEVDRGGYC